MNRKIIGMFEIFLMVSVVFSFSFIMGESSDLFEGASESKGLGELYGKLVTKILGDNLVSAAEVGAYTCLKTKSGALCQEYAVNTDSDLESCNDLCEEDCIPTGRDNVAECKIGTCFDPREGTCQAGSPKKYCEDFQGEWFDDPYENVAECREGCCVLGDQTTFVSQQQCIRQSELLGRELDYRPEVDTELACLVLANSQEEGACVFLSEDPAEKNDCRFGTKAKCIEQGGDFYAEYLCSNPELRTECVAQDSAKCVENKEGLYWFDSCGNRENIYDVDKTKSWNSGKVLAEQESCSVSSDSDPVGNQRNCGNCQYLGGSICGEKSGQERLSDSSIDFVCRSLECIDSEGRERRNGESWCEYQGAIGLDSDGQRSRDTPGSRHFRASCLDGEIVQDACADYRNEICVEEQTDLDNGESYSTAACRLNRWQECFEYNSDYLKSQGRDQSALEKRNDLCEKNPDCSINAVSVSGSFNFDMCAPKYPPGFSLERNPDGAEQICSIGSQTCTVVWVKEIDGDWHCAANCECYSAKFAQEMNNLCMSLGDCGASVNYQGELTQNYQLSGAPGLSQAYLNEIQRYSEVERGKFAEVGDSDDFFNSIGIPNNLGRGENPRDQTEEFRSSSAMIAGAIGTLLPLAASAGIAIPGLVTIAGTTSAIDASLANFFGPIEGGGLGGPVAPGLQALGGALIGAALGFAAVSFLIDFTGIGAGLDPGVTYALLGAGAVGGAITGFSIVSSGGTSGLLTGFTALGPILLAAVIIAIIVFAIIGVGDISQQYVTFSCQPWQAPTGGSDCESCGGDGYSCSEYSCKSLGQTCEFLNEGTEEEICISVRDDDNRPPRISPWPEALSENYEYEDVSDLGYSLVSDLNDGCISAYEEVTFGIQLDEPGRCRVDSEHKNEFDDMAFQFGNRNLFLYNHSHAVVVPNLESLGLPGYDPTRRADYDLLVRCQDQSGNVNLQEYVIDMCIKPGIDVSPPVIREHFPATRFVKHNSTEVNVTIYVNEPSDCKWDIVDKDYESMINPMDCETGLGARGLYGWACSSLLPISETENEFFVRCEDQPWLVEATETEGAYIEVDEGNGIRKIEVEDDRKRNANVNSYVIEYDRTESDLSIESISPRDETLVYGVQPVSVEVVVETSGGIDGRAECEYSFGGPYISFFNTFERIHIQVFQSFTAGNKKINIRCEDRAGNVASEISEFEIKIDTGAPEITRVFDLGGTLNVITNEDAECGFVLEGQRSGNQCNFNLDDSEVQIMSGSGTVHTSNFVEDREHYIKCRDVFGNYKGDCGLVVRSGEI